MKPKDARRLIVSILTSALVCLVVACGSALVAGGGSSSTAASDPGSPPAGTTGNCAGVAPPAAAASVGYTQLSFCDDFDSISTIDVSGTGAPGYNWYTHLAPWHGGMISQTAYSVSNSALTIAGASGTVNFGLSTEDPQTGSGTAFKFGYFEARISFDPSLSAQSSGWPAFWSLATSHLLDGEEGNYAELDFFEAGVDASHNFKGDFFGTLHNWQDDIAIDYSNANRGQPVNIDWSGWHTVATLWMPGQVTWYLDGRELMTQAYGPDQAPRPPAATQGGSSTNQTGVFSVLDTDTMDVILGSGPGWPLLVDWVRIWQE